MSTYDFDLTPTIFYLKDNDFSLEDWERLRFCKTEREMRLRDVGLREQERMKERLKMIMNIRPWNHT